MLRISVILIFFFNFKILSASDLINFNNFQNNEVVNWSSEEGQKRFYKSKYKADFVVLAPNFQAQINPLYCGIASTVVVLNSFYDNFRPNQKELATNFPKEIGNKRINFNLYSQLTLLDEKTDQIKLRDIIEFKAPNIDGRYDPGLSLLDLSLLFQYYGLKTKIYYVDKKGDSENLDIFRTFLKESLNNSDDVIIVNFYGKTYGATTGGHISPIAAYDQKSDSVLILDVASHKNPWYWVRTDLLYQAMNTKDSSKYRGYLLVSK